MRSTRTALRLAVEPRIVRRSVITALVVGTLLAFVNHGPQLLGLILTPEKLWPILIGYGIPYVISTISSVAATCPVVAVPAGRAVR